MNRRNFLTRLSTGLVGACLAYNVPTAILPAKVRTRAAQEYMTREYNRVCKGVGTHAPRWIYVGPALYDAFVAEMGSFKRFEAQPRKPEIGVLFKSARVYRANSPYVGPWSMLFMFKGESRPAVHVDHETLWRNRA